MSKPEYILSVQGQLRKHTIGPIKVDDYSQWCRRTDDEDPNGYPVAFDGDPPIKYRLLNSDGSFMPKEQAAEIFRKITE